MTGVAAALAGVAALGATTFASGPALTDAGSANTKATGISSPDKISPQWRETTVAQGSNALENPSALTGYYGYYNDGPMVPAPGAVQSPGHNVEASKSEPDKNTYLVVKGQHGADPKYDYGTHFLYQGHELGTTGSYITRVNLDADAAHRVTKLAETEADGSTPVPVIDGSTWDPFAQRLLFTTEGGSAGGVVEATLDYPSKVSNLWGVLGQGGYEGIQNDDEGNVYIVEDSGGPAGKVSTHAKQPNSFLFRFLPIRSVEPRQGREAAGTPGCVARARRTDRLPRRSGGRGHPLGRHEGSAHLRQDLQDHVGHRPRHRQGRHGGVRRERGCEEGRRHAVQAARERRLQAGGRLHEVLLHGDRRHDAASEAGAAYGGFGGPELQQDPAATRASCGSSTSPTRHTRASTTSRSSTRPM